MPKQDFIDALRDLGIRCPRDSLAALFKHVAKSRQSFVEGIEQLVVLEQREREGRNLATRMKSATLGCVPSLDSFDWSHPRKIDRSLYDTLLSMDFVGKKQNVLLRGPSGVGKSTLAQNLGLAALRSGLTVRFGSMAAVLADLLRQESLPATERRLRFYTKPDLLVLDELGYLPCDNQAADMLFNIISRRHERRSTVITTNMSFKQWGTLFDGAACVPALVDRFAQHCHVMDIDADSWRKKTAITAQS